MVHHISPTCYTLNYAIQLDPLQRLHPTGFPTAGRTSLAAKPQMMLAISSQIFVSSDLVPPHYLKLFSHSIKHFLYIILGSLQGRIETPTSCCPQWRRGSNGTNLPNQEAERHDSLMRAIHSGSCESLCLESSSKDVISIYPPGSPSKALLKMIFYFPRCDIRYV